MELEVWPTYCWPQILQVIAYTRLLKSQENLWGMMYRLCVEWLTMAPLWSQRAQYLQLRLVHSLVGLMGESGPDAVGLYLSLEETR